MVIDASVVVAAIIDLDQRGEDARSLLGTDWLAVAPAVIDVEVFHSIRRLWLRGVIGEAQFESGIGRLERLELIRFPVEPLLNRMFELRRTVSGFDAAYVALAERVDMTLATGDHRLAAATGPRCAFYVLQPA